MNKFTFNLHLGVTEALCPLQPSLHFMAQGQQSPVSLGLTWRMLIDAVVLSTVFLAFLALALLCPLLVINLL